MTEPGPNTAAGAGPIGPAPAPGKPVRFRPWDPALPEAAARVVALIREAAPDAAVEHVGSSAVPGCPGKGHLDLVLPYRDPVHLARLNAAVFGLGFGRQQGREPFPEERPMRVGTIDHAGATHVIHLHIVPEASGEAAELTTFRDRLRADPALVAAYGRLKQELVESGVTDGIAYTHAKSAFILGVLGEMTGDQARSAIATPDARPEGR